MKEKIIEGIVIFSGEFRNGETKKFEVEVMDDESGKIKNIRYDIDSKLEVGDRVEITYATNVQKENYGLKFMKLDKEEPIYIAKILRAGYLR